jgi:4-coumarate--CoA ligase
MIRSALHVECSRSIIVCPDKEFADCSLRTTYFASSICSSRYRTGHYAVIRSQGVLEFDQKVATCTRTVLIPRYEITHLYIVPPVLLTLSIQPLSSFEFDHEILEIYSAAAPLPSSLDPKIRAMFPTARLRQAWGMTESAVCLTVCPPSGPNRHHSAGIIYPSVQLVLVDPETLESVPPTEVGEVCVRSPSITMGYHGNPEATKETFDVLGDGSGWMRTGDAATFEYDHGMNWIVIKDRLKEVIKVLGQQVAPAELESLLLSHPKVVDAAVVGRPNEKVGELPWGFVVAKGSTKGLEKELLKWVEGHVVKYKRLGGITFVEKIEKNPSGKILRRVYREILKQETAREVKARL